MDTLSPWDMVLGSRKKACETPGARGDRLKNWPRRDDCSMTAPEGGLVCAGIQLGRSGMMEAMGLTWVRRIIAYVNANEGYTLMADW